MQLYHVISDLILAATGLFVFFKYLAKLELSHEILWESFVLSVTAAAIFGAINFMGFSQANLISDFFQKIATLTGAVGLAVASFALIRGIEIPKLMAYIALTIGFLLYVIAEIFKFKILELYVPIISMLSVAVIALAGLFSGKTKSSIWLLIAVGCFGLGTYRNNIFGDSETTIDIFHLLTAGGLFSIGKANS
jgi:hypothetical protein